jgi:mannosyl-3-phosphoglycerate phosphatase
MVVFMALDGMPGDRNSPEFAAATEALKLLARCGIPLVLCSSRTRAEIARIQQDLGIVQPFVSENGAALFVPEGYFAFAPQGAQRRQGFEVVEFGRPYSEAVAALRATAASLGVQVIGFSDMSIADVARECGLSLSQARLAKLREYAEPFRIPDNVTPSRYRCTARNGETSSRSGWAPRWTM